jgi:hypothetical protein
VNQSAVRKLFIIGCPRSGTTWMQLLLAQNPAIATAPETQIFAYYLEHFRRQWRHEQKGNGGGEQGGAGLHRLLSEDDFEELCRCSATMVLNRILETKPDASLVAEKSPKHALMADFILRIFPDAYFLHVVRDPRDTVASLLAASRGWGRGWAPSHAVPAARLWLDCVNGARAVAGGRYYEVRYETLRERPVEELGAILQWLDLPADAADCERWVSACEISELRKTPAGTNLPVPGARSPTGFFRRGAVGGWQTELRRSDVRIIEHICGAAMTQLNYARVSDGQSPTRPVRMLAYDTVQRVRESIDWQLARLAGQL